MRVDQFLFQCDLCGTEVTTSPPRKDLLAPVPAPVDWCEVRYDTKDRLNAAAHVCGACVSKIMDYRHKQRYPQPGS